MREATENTRILFIYTLFFRQCVSFDSRTSSISFWHFVHDLFIALKTFRFVCFSFFSFNSFGSVLLRSLVCIVCARACVLSCRMEKKEKKINFYGCALFARSLHDRETRNLQRTLSLCIRNDFGAKRVLSVLCL